MALELTARVVCDTCSRSHESLGNWKRVAPPKKEAREFARTDGWVQTRVKTTAGTTECRDLCPACADALEDEALKASETSRRRTRRRTKRKQPARKGPPHCWHCEEVLHADRCTCIYDEEGGTL